MSTKGGIFMTRSTKTISCIAVGSLVAAGAYHFIKKRKTKGTTAESLVGSYNENHANGQIVFDGIDDTKEIDCGNRKYHNLTKILKTKK